MPDDGISGPEQPRHRIKRTRTGCLTCKQRRVKCGEERPECARCKVAARTCVYGSDVSPEDTTSSNTSSTPKPSPAENDDSAQRNAAVRYYAEHMLPAQDGLWDMARVANLSRCVDFRGRERERLTGDRAEPTVEPLVCAFAAAHSATWDPSTPFSKAFYFRCVEQGLKKMIDTRLRKPYEAHILCNLLLAFAELTRTCDPKSIAGFLRSFIKVMEDWQSEEQHANPLPADANFWKETIGSHATYAQFLEEISSSKTLDSRRLMYNFPDLSSAAITLDNIMNHWVIPVVAKTSSSWVQTPNTGLVQQMLDTWHCAFTDSQFGSPRSRPSPAANLLLMHFNVGCLLLEQSLSPLGSHPERGKAALLADQILQALESLAFTPLATNPAIPISDGQALGILPALFVVSTRSPHPSQRARAIKLLAAWSLARHTADGAWNGVAAGLIAQACSHATAAHTAAAVLPVVTVARADCHFSPAGERAVLTVHLHIEGAAAGAPTTVQQLEMTDRREVGALRAVRWPLGACVRSGGYYGADRYRCMALMSPAFARMRAGAEAGAAS